MKFGKFARAFAPVAAMALAAALSGCDGKISINGEEGKKLSELDLTGKAPDELVLLGPDEVRVTQGDKLAITLEGPAEVTDQMRFTLDGTSLGVLREGKWNSADRGVAIVNVVMPAPRELTMAGSGKITSAALARDAKVTIAGSGLIDTPGVSGNSLELTIAGSGSYRAAGNVTRLNVTVAGSGDAAMDALKADTVKVSIAGSGDTAFASDGEVKADIMGSGEVRVKGRARCTVNAMGSGRLVCEPGPETKDATPEPPAAPNAPN